MTTERQSEIVARLTELAVKAVPMLVELLPELLAKPRPVAVRAVGASDPALLDAFIAENCHEVPGAKTTYKEFRHRFQRWLAERGEQGPGRNNLMKMLPPRFPFGKGGHNIRYVGNLAWEPRSTEGPAYIAIGGKLKQM